jgi:hypothetical protein
MAPKWDEWIAATYQDLQSKFDLGTAAPLKIMPKIITIPAALTTWQTVYDFLKDIADAYNELLQAACPFLNKTCLGEASFGRHLMLGATETATNYRHFFESATVLTATPSEIAAIQRFFKRLTALIEHFEPNSLTTDSLLRISPSHTAVMELGRRAIPFYYSKTGVENDWQAGNPCIHSDLTGYHFQDFMATPTPAMEPDFNWQYDKNNFFRIEGHLERPVIQIKNEIFALKEKYNLEFELRTFRFSPNPPPNLHTSVLDDLRKMILTINYELAKSGLRQYDNLGLNAPMLSSSNFKRIFREVMQPFYNNQFTDPLRRWEQLRCGMSFSGDVGFWESDYLLLRAELLTYFKRFKRAFKPLMKAYKFSFRAYAKPNSELTTNLTKKEVSILVQVKLFWRYLHLLSDELLPLNLVAFAYPIFIEVFKEWHRIVYELRASVSGFWANQMIEDLVKQLDSQAILPNNKFVFELLPEFQTRLQLYLNRQTMDFNSQTRKADKAFTVLAGLMNHFATSLSDIFVFINAHFEGKMQQQLATLYYSLESIIQQKPLIFKDFAQKQSGLEHLSGVEKGGTFVLAVNDMDQVVADFALTGRGVEQDCTFKPERIRLPPIAGVNVVYLVAKRLTKLNFNLWKLDANANIGVLRNDFSLRKTSSACATLDNSELYVTLPFNVSERNGNLQMMRKHWGMIHYEIQLELRHSIVFADAAGVELISPLTYDLFDYELHDVNGLSDRGKVIVIIVPPNFLEVQREKIFL